MTVFKVQTYQDAYSGYETAVSFTPDYVWCVAKVWRRWWFPWPRIEVGVIKNLRPAEKKALKKALIQSRILYRRMKTATRIQRVKVLNGKETKDVIWLNGRILDPLIRPWYQRFVYEIWKAIVDEIRAEKARA
jgi:hypothetical protein